MRENKTQYAILGMLSFGLKSGYDISRGIQNSTAYFWAESDGQIYPILKKLCKQGLVKLSEAKKSGKHDKKNYAITPLGKKALTAWLERSPATYHYRNEFLLQLFFGRHLPTEKNIEKIKHYQLGLKQQLSLFNTFENVIKEKSREPIFSLLTLDFGRDSLKAEIAWCDHAIKTLEKHHA